MTVPFFETTLIFRYWYRSPPPNWHYPSLIVRAIQPFIQNPSFFAPHCVAVTSVFGGCVSPLYSVFIESISISICRPFIVPGGCLISVRTQNLRLSSPESKHGCKFADLSLLIGSFGRVAPTLVRPLIFDSSFCKPELIPLLTSPSSHIINTFQFCSTDVHF